MAMRINAANKTGFLALILCLAAALAMPPLAFSHSLEKFEQKIHKREAYAQIVQGKAPGFTLMDADGKKVELSDFRGNVVVMNFLYTNCPDICPLHSEKVASIQESINQTPMKDMVQFITITTDPAFDTPKILKSYGREHGLDLVNWIFLTSGVNKPAATRKLAERYGFKFTLGKEGYQMHGIVTMIIDKIGNLRAKYHGLKFNKTTMILHINAFTNDNH